MDALDGNAIAGLLFLVRLLAEKRRQAKLALTKFSWRAHVPSLVGMALLIALSVGLTRVIPKFQRLYRNSQPTITLGPDDWKNSRRLKRDLVIEPQADAPGCYATVSTLPSSPVNNSSTSSLGCFLAMSALSVSVMACRRFDDSPTLSGGVVTAFWGTKSPTSP